MAKDFEVQGVQAISGMDGKQPFFEITLTMRRAVMSNVISLFIPTWLIWLLAYLTFYIDLQNFNNRFMGSVTSLLVLASLLDSMQSKLPETSYFKYIDLWFLWYIINSIVMIGSHVIIANVQESQLSPSKSLACPRKNYKMPKDQIKRRERTNEIAKVIFPLLTVPFNLLYFTINLI